jgi:hypothetical protein
MSANKVQYYDLDDIGAIGVIAKRSSEELRRDAEEMAAVIRAYKLGQASVTKGSSSSSKRHSQPSANAVKRPSHSSKVRSSRKATITGK